MIFILGIVTGIGIEQRKERRDFGKKNLDDLMFDHYSRGFKSGQKSMAKELQQAATKQVQFDEWMESKHDN